MVQMLLEWKAPGLNPAPRFAASLQHVSAYEARPVGEQLHIATVSEIFYLTQDNYPGKTLINAGTQHYVVENNPRLAVMVSGYPAGNLTALLTNHSVYQADGGLKDPLLNQYAAPAAAWAAGVKAGPTILKITTKTFAPEAAETGEIKAVWLVVVGRTGKFYPVGKVSAPATVMKQVTDALGFPPVLIAAQAVQFKKWEELKTQWAQTRYNMAVADDGQRFTARVSLNAPLPTTPVVFREVFEIDSVGWLGAPVLAGPLGGADEEVYAVVAAEPAGAPVEAK